MCGVFRYDMVTGHFAVLMNSSGMIFDPADPDRFVIVVPHASSTDDIVDGTNGPGEIGEAIIRVARE